MSHLAIDSTKSL